MGRPIWPAREAEQVKLNSILYIASISQLVRAGQPECNSSKAYMSQEGQQQHAPPYLLLVVSLLYKLR